MAYTYFSEWVGREIANVPEFGTGYGVFSGTLSGYNNISING